MQFLKHYYIKINFWSTLRCKSETICRIEPE